MVEEIDPLMVGEYCYFRRMRVHLVQDKRMELVDVLDDYVLFHSQSNSLEELGSLLLSG